MMDGEEIRCHTEWIHLAKDTVPWWILVNTTIKLWLDKRHTLLAKLKATSCVMTVLSGVYHQSVHVQFAVHKVAIGQVAL